MAFLRYANASVVKPAISMPAWDDVRGKALNNPVLSKRASVVLQKYDPSQYLLSHATIIASVDTEETGLPLGRQIVDGFQIDRRYGDFLITPQTQQYINNNCFVPGTMILMGDGTEKSIEDIRVGDSVISHTGNVRKVVQTFRREFKGNLKSVLRLGDQRLLEATAEHPFLAMVPSTQCACGCGTGLNRRDRKAAVHRFQDYVRGHGCLPRKHEKPGFNWVSLGLLERGDFLSAPRVQGEIQVLGLTPGKARLLGYYLAEGYYHRQKPHRVRQIYRSALGSTDGSSVPVAVSFALNLDEEETLAKTIRHLLQTEFGVGSSIQRASKNGIVVHSQQSIELVQFIKAHATEYAKTKKLTSDVLFWPIDLQKELVRGWLEGDGCVQATAGGWVGVTSASSELISQMQVILGRLGVFSTRGMTKAVGRKRLKVANGSYQVVNDPSKTCVSYKLQIGSVYAERLLGGSHLEALFRRSIRNRHKHSLRFRLDPCRTMFPIRSVQSVPYNGPLFNFETEVDNSYVANGVSVHNCDSWERRLLLATYRTFIGGENYVEHLQIPEMSKGKIIDAAARDIGDSVYVDILIATDLKHAPLVRAIQSRQVQTLSMGCQVSHTTCTKCGNVAEDESLLCPHIRYMKGQYFLDGLGNKRKIAELCGHRSDPNSVKFIEASWVAHPAFTGAVLRNILSPKEISRLQNKVQLAFSQPTRVSDPGALQRAARLLSSAEDNFDFGQGGEFEGANDTKTPEKPKEEDPLEKAVGDLADFLKERAIEKVRGQIGKGELPSAHDMNLNETLIRESTSSEWKSISRAIQARVSDSGVARKMLYGLMLYKRGGWSAVQASRDFNGSEFLAVSRLVDTFTGTPKFAGESRVYRAVLSVGGCSVYKDNESYLAACRRVFGRDLTGSERDALITKGRLYDLGS